MTDKTLIRAWYEEQAKQAGTFGGRAYDVPKCPHGCCPDAVCDFVQDCDSHQREAS